MSSPDTKKTPLVAAIEPVKSRQNVAGEANSNTHVAVTVQDAPGVTLPEPAQSRLSKTESAAVKPVQDEGITQRQPRICRRSKFKTKRRSRSHDVRFFKRKDAGKSVSGINKYLSHDSLNKTGQHDKEIMDNHSLEISGSLTQIKKFFKQIKKDGAPDKEPDSTIIRKNSVPDQRISHDETPAKSRLTSTRKSPSPVNDSVSNIFRKSLADVQAQTVVSDKTQTLNNVQEQNCNGIGKDVDYWVDAIPLTQRKNVQPYIPPVQGLYYVKNKLKNEYWQDTELGNIRKLLNSQAKIKFYIYDVSRKKIAQCLENGTLEVMKMFFDELCMNTKKWSQYIVLRQFKLDIRCKQYQILGIVKVEGNKMNNHHSRSRSNKFQKIPVSILSLSTPFKVPSHWVQPMKTPQPIELSDAKTILKSYQLSLSNRSSIPYVTNVYVSLYLFLFVPVHELSDLLVIYKINPTGCIS